MARKDWERVIEERTRSKPSPSPSEVKKPEPERVAESGVLTAAQRRTRMLEQAERSGHVTEAIAMLSLVRTVEGFTNMGAVYAVPNRSQIDAEFVRGAKSENQARARVWRRLRELQKKLDYEMPGERKGYARPSDWERLFAALAKATHPEGAPDVFSVQSTGDRVQFRKWAEQFGLNGDGLVHAGQLMREMYEKETGQKFQPEKVIPKIQAFTADQLDVIVRAGFEPRDTFIGDQGRSYIPMSTLSSRFDPAQRRLRDREIRAHAERLIQELPPAATQGEQERLREQQFRRARQEYDHTHFSAVEPSRNSVASDGMGIVGGVFATVKIEEGLATGFGYHGITQPDVLKLAPEELVHTERSQPAVSASTGKTVVRVDRWLGNRDGVQLMGEEEVVASKETRGIEQTATRKIADAVVYDKHEKVPAHVAYPKYIERPYYWNDVHWAYKNLVEKRLPFLARVAGVDPTPIEQFAGEDAENEWMYARILSTGVTADKQLNDLRDHFILRLEDVFSEGPDRSALELADRQYPEAVKLGNSEFPVQYEWSADGRFVEKANVPILDQGSYGNAYKLKDANPAEIPVLGIPERPVAIIFRYEQRSEFFHQSEDYPSSRLRQLLERIEPQERMIERKWYDFELTETGKLRIPLTITPQDSFPTTEQIKILLAPHEESVVFCTDRDGKEHRAYITLWYVEGDHYDLGYVKDQKTAQEWLARAREKHTELQAAEKVRAEMGGEAMEQQLAPIRELERQMKVYTQEFENDNLVAFVLGSSPFSEDDQGRLNQALKENNFKYAKLILENALSDRKRSQELVDLMRKVSAIVVQLLALGFDWQRFNVNKRNRGGDEEDDFGGFRGRADRDGFYPGDVKVHNYEIYLPSMGRKVDHRLDEFRLRRGLPDFQRRLEYELETWKLKKDKLRAERESTGPPETAQPFPEVVRRGPALEDDEEEGEG